MSLKQSLRMHLIKCFEARKAIRPSKTKPPGRAERCHSAERREAVRPTRRATMVYKCLFVKNIAKHRLRPYVQVVFADSESRAWNIIRGSSKFRWDRLPRAAFAESFFEILRNKTTLKHEAQISMTHHIMKCSSFVKLPPLINNEQMQGIGFCTSHPLLD